MCMCLNISVCVFVITLLGGENVNGWKIKSEANILLFLHYIFSVKNVIIGEIFCKHFLSVQ